MHSRTTEFYTNQRPHMATLRETQLASLQTKKEGLQWYSGQEAADYQVLLDNVVNSRFEAYGNQSRSYKLAKANKTSFDNAMAEAPALIAEIDALVADIND